MFRSLIHSNNVLFNCCTPNHVNEKGVHSQPGEQIITVLQTLLEKCICGTCCSRPSRSKMIQQRLILFLETISVRPRLLRQKQPIIFKLGRQSLYTSVLELTCICLSYMVAASTLRYRGPCSSLENPVPLVNSPCGLNLSGP